MPIRELSLYRLDYVMAMENNINSLFFPYLGGSQTLGKYATFEETRVFKDVSQARQNRHSRPLQEGHSLIRHEICIYVS